MYSTLFILVHGTLLITYPTGYELVAGIQYPYIDHVQGANVGQKKN